MALLASLAPLSLCLDVSRAQTCFLDGTSILAAAAISLVCAELAHHG